MHKRFDDCGGESHKWEQLELELTTPTDDTPEEREAWNALEKRKQSTKASPLDVQVGGNHYKNLKIQPAEFIEVNKLSFLEGCVIKRLCRWRNKDGIKDLEKAIHEIQLMIEIEKKLA